MLEKLVENWLDSANERSYQPIFVQMLVGRGYSVLHSTRHCALEYGKDVIAVAPDGRPCAFQLKGNPGGRLRLSQFRSEIQAQLLQLISQPIVYPGIPENFPHRSYLVSNGYFEEEVQRAIDDLNRGNYMSKIELIGRGQLLEWANELGVNLWPSEISNVRELLEVFLHDGRDLLPMQRFSTILESQLALRITDDAVTQTELQRRATSSALLTGISSHHFAMAENHFAVATAWCQFAVSLISAFERWEFDVADSARQSLSLAQDAIKDSLVALWDEAQKRPNLVEGDRWADPEVYRWRYTLLCGLFSTLWFFPGNTNEDRERQTAIASWLNRQHRHLELWGEGAMPCILALLFLLRRVDATMKPDQELSSLLKAVVDANQRHGSEILSDPYYSFEDIARIRYALRPTDDSANLQDESFVESSYSAELLLHLVARSRLKSPCRFNWPNFNRLGHKRFIPAASWQYGLWNCSEGVEETRQYPSEYSWKQLCEDAAVESCSYLPKELIARPHLLLLWVIIAPHRLTPDVGRLLSSSLRAA